MGVECPTCSHTMAQLVGVAGRFWDHCERCGTVVVTQSGDPDGYRDVYVPKLVERCRSFEEHIPEPGKYLNLGVEWAALGIKESIRRPEDRK